MDSVFWERLKEKNYDLGFYLLDELILQDEAMTQFNNIIDEAWSIKDYWAFIRWNIQITGYKYAPYDLKRFCFVNPDAFSDIKKLPDGYVPYRGRVDELYGIMQDTTVDDAEGNVFKYIHWDAAHTPHHYDAEVNYVENGTYWGQIEASVTITDAWLKRLKEADVYDNSVIIIMSDHGWYNLWGDDTLTVQSPLLLIKGLQEKHDFQISESPISYYDLPEAFEKLLNGESGDNVFRWKPGEYRERRLLSIPDAGVQAGDEIKEYIQTGKAWENDTAVVNPYIWKENQS